MKRLAAVQASPMLRSLASIAPATAASRSASSKTTNGALPPSSIEVRRTVSDASASSRRPTSVDPVKESFRSRESLISGPVVAPAVEVGMTFRTPAGSPASCITAANSCEVSGVRLADFRTMVQPAATAGAILRVAMASGKFHGVISRHGPTGFLVTSSRDLPSGETE